MCLMYMQIPNPSMSMVVFSQWINQSYNVGVNLANKSSQEELNVKEVSLAYSKLLQST